MLGFKSFANKTKLEFEPGMTAIVGPNGCGKSNIADAFRWVLGEQSAKSLRAGKMEDVIFNGTDARKPLGMAEVSISFVDCEKQLGTEFNEVTVTRRVFRSGEGQYFMNKTPCRLKDIQRLFMDTGIGTTSYSFMEQGRIDQILSSRPEDRREVFEEASGITKFKADKKEAIRKLDQTEANLIRLADVLREVKRQIGSLQRQAGKARRYKEMKDELRKLDLTVTRQRMKDSETIIRQLEGEVRTMADKIAAMHGEVEELEQNTAGLRAGLVQTERDIGAVLEAGVQARTRLDHARELIQVNRQRIDEYRQLSERDTKEIDATRGMIAEHRRQLEEYTQSLATSRSDRSQAEKDLQSANDLLASHQQQVESIRAQIQKMRIESVDLEAMHFKLQNEVVEIESRAREGVIRRERLAAEKGQLARTCAAYDQREKEVSAALQDLQGQLTSAADAMQTAEFDRAEKEKSLRETEQRCAEHQSLLAAKNAQIDMLTAAADTAEDFPGGARYLMDQAGRTAAGFEGVVGTLAASLDAEPGYGQAVEAALRPWFDAIVVKSADAARALVAAVASARQGSARLVPLSPADAAQLPKCPAQAVRLADHVRCPEAIAGLVRMLLGRVFVVDSLDQVPAAPADGCAFVTRDGILVHGGGIAEYWMRDAHAGNPLSRRHLVAEAQSSAEELGVALAAHQQAAGRLRSEISSLDAMLKEHRATLDARKRSLAQKEGEHQVTAREAREARERLETVAWEHDNLSRQDVAGDTHRQGLVSKIGEIQAQRESNSAAIRDQTNALHNIETKNAELQTRATEARIRFVGLNQRAEHIEQQHATLESRIRELDSTVEGRTRGMRSYQEHVSGLTQAIETAESQLSSLQESVATTAARAESLKKDRETQTLELRDVELALAARRTSLEDMREQRNQRDLRLSETRMRLQNTIDRFTTDYRMTADQIKDEPDPVWDGDPPSAESVETQAAELRTKLEAMGPVNLVAIEECSELEDRLAFLSAQETDLVNSKQQLIEMIKKINLTTSEMFRVTFERVNANFQVMFEKLFNGGTAKLVLVNEEDVLDCGIEIIARPPGKRLQNVSLLSGGERTMTAVALLFSIYMIKPSPFCLLDELDAALDESNIGRFVRILQEFLDQSQFVVITHNRQTIAAANILYGVTMPNKGISEIVSMRFAQRKPSDGNPLTAVTPVAPPATADGGTTGNA